MSEIKSSIDFIGVGSAKSGTSWLGVCLDEHPQINMSKVKSLFFFNDDKGNQYVKDNWTNYSRGIDWYMDQFPPEEEGKIRGEYGVSYLHDPVACQRIKEHFPDTKILVSLRNPADMLYSLYWYARNTVEIKVPETFEELVEQNIYVDRGNYSKHLQRYYDNFPSENIYVVIFDDIKEIPEKVTEELYDYLGVDPNFKPSVLSKRVYSSIGHKSQFLKRLGYFVLSTLEALGLKKVKLMFLNNKVFYDVYAKLNVVEKKYPPMNPETRKKLLEYYAEDIQKLEKLINRDLTRWKK